MLQFILQLGQVLNNGLALFPLLLVGHIADCSVEVVDGAGLGEITVISMMIPIERMIAYQNNRPSLMGRYVAEAGTVGGVELRWWRG